MITWTVLFKKMEEKTDRIKKENQDKIRKFKSKGIFSLNNVIVKKNGNVKTKHYLTPKETTERNKQWFTKYKGIFIKYIFTS